MAESAETISSKIKKFISLNALLARHYCQLLCNPPKAKKFFTNLYILSLLPEDFPLGEKLSALEKLEEEKKRPPEPTAPPVVKCSPPAVQMILTLSNPSDSQDTFPLLIHVEDTPIAKKWIAELKNSLSLGDPWQTQLNHLEKNFCFMGFPNHQRDLPFLCQELNNYIKEINQVVLKHHWPKEYYINLHFTPEKVMEQELLDRELLNKIHHYFEILSGPVWKRSDFFQKASVRVFYALRQINNLCHEMEHFTRNVMMNKQDPDAYAPYMQFSFLKSRRLALADEDYQHFSLDRNFGQLNMHYCQTGKTHWEAFNDQDEEIFEENIAGLRFYSAEFDIDLGPWWSEEDLNSWWWKEKKEKFQEWLIRHHFDPQDKKLALGTLKIGQMDLDQFGTKKHGEVIRFLSRYLNIQKISIIDAHGVVEKNFPYSWSDHGYMKRQFELTKIVDHVTDY